jgi:uncharacterized protein (TIGR02246 family)
MFQAVVFSFLLLAFQPLFGASQTFSQNDEDAIRNVIEEHYKAWNQHDVKKMAELYANDGDIRTPWNQVAKNRSEIEAMYRSELPKNNNAHIAYTIQSIRMIKPNIAFAEVASTISGMQTQDKSHYLPFHHRVVYVLVKRGSWQILIGRPF